MIKYKIKTYKISIHYDPNGRLEQQLIYMNLTSHSIIRGSNDVLYVLQGPGGLPRLQSQQAILENRGQMMDQMMDLLLGCWPLTRYL
jgi:hypothetical protein